jgi:hypothetical protein
MFDILPLVNGTTFLEDLEIGIPNFWLSQRADGNGAIKVGEMSTIQMANQVGGAKV